MFCGKHQLKNEKSVRNLDSRQISSALKCLMTFTGSKFKTQTVIFTFINENNYNLQVITNVSDIAL